MAGAAEQKLDVVVGCSGINRRKKWWTEKRMLSVKSFAATMIRIIAQSGQNNFAGDWIFIFQQ